MWDMRVVAVAEEVVEVYSSFELRYNMVGRFAIQFFCGGFLDGKMTAWLNG